MVMDLTPPVTRTGVRVKEAAKAAPLQPRALIASDSFEVVASGYSVVTLGDEDCRPLQLA